MNTKPKPREEEARADMADLLVQMSADLSIGQRLRLAAELVDQTKITGTTPAQADGLRQRARHILKLVDKELLKELKS